MAPGDFSVDANVAGPQVPPAHSYMQGIPQPPQFALSVLFVSTQLMPHRVNAHMHMPPSHFSTFARQAWLHMPQFLSSLLRLTQVELHRWSHLHSPLTQC